MLLVTHPDTYPAERAYVQDVVLREFLGLQWVARTKSSGPVEIASSTDLEGPRLLIADRLFTTSPKAWLTEQSLPPRPLSRWDLTGSAISPTLVTPELPVIYGEQHHPGGFYEETSAGIRLGVDLFGSIFFQLSRYEELALPGRDEHGRFFADASLAWQEGFIDRPLVNEYVEVLRAALGRLWPALHTTRRRFQQRLSHDVDWPVHEHLTIPRAARAMIGDVLRRRDPGLLSTRIGTRRAQRRGRPSEDPYNTFDYIMDRSEERGVHSAFYFMAGATDPRFDSTYSLQEDWIGALIKRIHKRGHEIGLHPSYGTFRSPEAISAEFDILLRACERLGVSQDAWGGRQHFLRWENPITWRGWEQAGLSYDSSLGYSHSSGFRCGVCFEYPVFDLDARRQLRLRERPLVVMEMALIGEGGSGGVAALAKIELLRERCRRFGGDFTLLWHNSRLASQRERRLYEQAVVSRWSGRSRSAKRPA